MVESVDAETSKNDPDGLVYHIMNRSVAGLPLLPRSEQQLVVDHLDRETATFNRVEHILASQIDKLREYRQTVISSAVTGKTGVRQRKGGEL